jgi:hypothetical protein
MPNPPAAPAVANRFGIMVAASGGKEGGGQKKSHENDKSVSVNSDTFVHHGHNDKAVHRLSMH